MLDLDHFKRFNDTCGHRVGDLVLNHLGKLLLHAVRDTDIVARYGGEEIIVIATQTSAAAAVQLAERLRQHIETHQPEFPRDPARPCEMRVTVSIGVAELDAEIKDIRELVHSADQALYRAKQEGRNRVVMLNRKAE
jgi:diguanylate cyclase (GGDEF)-like protein